MRSRLARIRCAAALALVLLSPLAAAALDVAGRCSVRFFATSTLHDFEGEAPCALLAIEPADAAGRYAARAEVEIARMTTGIAARDRKMREMFQAKRFPRIVAAFGAVDPAALRAGADGALAFRLSMHGAERDVVPTVTGFTEVPGQSARFRASFTLALSDYGMRGPVAMGFIRVADGVRVEVDVELSAASAASPPPPAAR